MGYKSRVLTHHYLKVCRHLGRMKGFLLLEECLSARSRAIRYWVLNGFFGPQIHQRNQWAYVKKRPLFKYASGLPWWFRGKEPSCQCRGHGFHPWSGRIPSVWSSEAQVPLLSLCSRAGEPRLLNPRAVTAEARVPLSLHLLQEKPLQWEVCLLATTRESMRAASKTLCRKNNKEIHKIIF